MSKLQAGCTVQQELLLALEQQGVHHGDETSRCKLQSARSEEMVDKVDRISKFADRLAENLQLNADNVLVEKSLSSWRS